MTDRGMPGTLTLAKQFKERFEWPTPHKLKQVLTTRLD
jgi:hypothetical protein